MEIPEPITQLINQARNGDEKARKRLWDIVFPVLKEKAKRLLKGDEVAGVMRPSDLLQEAMIQLLRREKVGWNDRKHLFGFAVRVMRNIITDHARRSLRKGRLATPIDEALELIINEDVSLVEVDEVLNQLAKVDPVKAEIVELRLYGGLTNEEIADHLEIAVATVKRHMTTARAFIMSRINPARKKN
jgi:RNA polymerase sigma factor (TIGR02999 family)